MDLGGTQFILEHTITGVFFCIDRAGAKESEYPTLREGTARPQNANKTLL